MVNVVVLIDESGMPGWVAEIVTHVEAAPHLALVGAVEERGSNQRKKGRRIYRLFRYLDRRLFGGSPDAFKRVSFSFRDNMTRIEVIPKKSEIKNEFPQEAIEAIRALKPDVILRFAFGILSGDILNVATHGVWSLHHDDNDVVRGGPPAFWEWYLKIPVTGVTLQRINDVLDGGDVLGKSFTTTDFTSLIRNQNKVFWSGAELLKRTLDYLAATGRPSLSGVRVIPFYSGILYRDPRWSQSFAAFLKLAGRAAARALNKATGTDQWALFFFIGKQRMPFLSLRHYKRLTPPADRFWADPFVVSRDDRHFIFFEEFIYSENKGHISSMVLDKDGRLLQTSVPILETPGHLSYPFIFEFEKTYFMIPESADRKTVELYECVDFPLKWQFRKTLMAGVEAFDSTLHFHEGLWWMFQTRRAHKGLAAHDELYLYYLEDFRTGEWRAHPKNPVVMDPRRARPAGRIFSVDGNWYRPSQICAPRYGYGISVNRIVTLSKTDYREEQAGVILPHWLKNLKSTHTLNFNTQITIIDGQVRRSRK